MEQGGLRTKGIIKRKGAGGKPLISVITVVYNGEKTLERAIKSVTGQTWDNIEYILIDGNSTDNSVEIIKKYGELIDFWISEPDKGISDAFNKGVSYCTGDFFAFLGSDDWYEPDGVERIAEKIIPGREIYAGHANLWTDNGNTFVKLHKSRPERIFQTMRIAHPATFVSQKVFEQIGGFSKEYKVAMDYDFMLRAKLKGFEILVVDHVITNMVLGGNSKDVLAASKDELRIKNKLIGVKLKHYLWFCIYITGNRILSLFNKLPAHEK